jgi:type II secretory pathway component PulL
MQIHKATAEQLGIKPNKDGMYEALAGRKIELFQHNQIVAQIQLDLKTHYQQIIDFLKSELNNAYSLEN